MRNLTGGGMFTLMENPSGNNAILLRQHDLDAAFLSPLEYAREGSEYHIVPRVALSSTDAAGAAILCFRDQREAITTIAVDPASISEIVLARILLGEQFDIRPAIVPVAGSLESMLAKADAALLVGNAALGLSAGPHSVIDLVEEWFEMTGLPYVHGFWCGREAGLTRQEITTLQHSQTGSAVSLHDVALSAPPDSAPTFSVPEIEEYLEHFSYDFTDDVEGAVTEFLRYAYFHGILPDVPDLQFYSLDADADLPPSLMN
jgi:chorismate dehydratase